MNTTFQMITTDNRPPEAVIPKHYMWDFIEYLALQRIRVVYTYCDEHFTVTFPNTDRERVEQLMDEWAARAADSLSAAA